MTHLVFLSTEQKRSVPIKDDLNETSLLEHLGSKILFPILSEQNRVRIARIHFIGQLPVIWPPGIHSIIDRKEKDTSSSRMRCMFRILSSKGASTTYSSYPCTLRTYLSTVMNGFADS